MPALSDAVVIGIVLTLIFTAVSYYIYTRMVQAETKLGLLESILLNLKMATEASLFMSMTEPPPAPPQFRVAKMPKSNEEIDSSELQQMIDEAHDNVQTTIKEENDKNIELTNSGVSNSSVSLHVVKDEDGNSKTHIGFESMSWKELCAEAKKRSIPGVSHMNRKKLIDILNKKENVISDKSWSQSNQDESEMVGMDLASIHDFPENGAPLEQ